MSVTSEQQFLLASQNLISMSQAAKFTPYSQEYLSLLARKGRLKAVKIGRNWPTMREFVVEYVKKQEDKHKKLMNKFKQLREISHIKSIL
jgi:hypothetical protein